MSSRVIIQLTVAGLMTNENYSWCTSFVTAILCFVCSTHASDSVILRCEGCRNPCCACSKSCVRSWYLGHDGYVGVVHVL